MRINFFISLFIFIKSSIVELSGTGPNLLLTNQNLSPDLNYESMYKLDKNKLKSNQWYKIRVHYLGAVRLVNLVRFSS